jgi:hypothetical protein
MSGEIKVPKVRKPRVPKEPTTNRKQPAVKLGIKQTARITSKRAIKDNLTANIKNPLLKFVTIAALGAVASYFINKQ